MRVKLTFLDIDTKDAQLLCRLAHNHKIFKNKDEMEIEEVKK